MRKNAIEKAADDVVQSFIKKTHSRCAATGAFVDKRADTTCKSSNVRSENIANKVMKHFGQQVKTETECLQKDIVNRLREELLRKRPLTSSLKYVKS